MAYHTNKVKAQLVIHDKETDELGNTVEIKLWQVPVSEHTPHGYKYSLVYIVRNRRVIGYDNERGKGDHRHLEGKEEPYLFSGLKKLVSDFRDDVDRYKERRHAG